MYLNNFKIRTKLGIIYVICVLLPVLATDFLFVQMITRSVSKEEYQNMGDILERVSYELSAKIDNVTSISDYLYMNERLNDFVERSYQSPEEYYESYEAFIEDNVIRYYYTAESVFNIQICTDNPGIISGSYFCRKDEVKDTVWYKRYLLDEEKIYIMAYYEEDSLYEQNKNQARHISLIRKMDNFGGNAVMKIDFDYEMLAGILKYDMMDADIYVCDGEKIILQSDAGQDWKADYQKPDKKTDRALTVSGDISVLNDTWEIEITKDRYSILEVSKVQKEAFLILLLINLILPSILIIIVDRSFEKRLLLTEKYIKKAEQKQFEVIPGEHGRDEIGKLIRSFNLMVMKIKELIEVVYKKDAEQKSIELAKNRAELEALKRQLNPHFMYNTLESIRMSSLVKGEKETADLIGKFAVLLRQITYWKQDFVKVWEEASAVEFYLELQKNRFGKRLEYTVDIQEEAKELEIPKFLLMAFVENSCIHGIEPLIEGGSIRVSITSDDTYIYLSVADSGVGIEEECLALLEEQIQNTTLEELKGTEHIGILNNVMRLKIYFQEEVQVVIKSKKNKGTEISIRVPQKKGEEHHVEGNAGR